MSSLPASHPSPAREPLLKPTAALPPRCRTCVAAAKCLAVQVRTLSRPGGDTSPGFSGIIVRCFEKLFKNKTKAVRDEAGRAFAAVAGIDGGSAIVGSVIDALRDDKTHSAHLLEMLKTMVSEADA